MQSPKAKIAAGEALVGMWKVSLTAFVIAALYFARDLHGGDAADPALEPSDQRRQQKGEERRKGQWNEQIARKIECGDDERGEADFPHADKRLRDRDFPFW